METCENFKLGNNNKDSIFLNKFCYSNFLNEGNYVRFTNQTNNNFGRTLDYDYLFVSLALGCFNISSKFSSNFFQLFFKISY